MISVSHARAIMLEHVRQMSVENVALRDALGRTLAAAVVATRAQPPFAASAMDGYAVRSTDTPGRLLVVGESGAGHALRRALGEGECARIFTGAPLPDGADAIVIQEEASRSGDEILAPETSAGRHVRARGVDFDAGATLLTAPRLLDGPSIAVAAAAGLPRVTVARQPRIVVISGGDEIVPPGVEPGPSQIFESSSFGVAGLATAWGAAPRTTPPLKDDAEAIAQAVRTALSASDLTVIIGGASVGDHDYARAAVAAIGGRVLFDKVALQPGKPTWFAVREDSAILGLPGNPTSALVCARLFLRPLIERMLGSDPLKACETRAARLRTPLQANGPRETYLRAITELDDNGQLWASRFENQDSSLVTVFAAANALIVRAPHQPASAREDIVPTLPI